MSPYNKYCTYTQAKRLNVLGIVERSEQSYTAHGTIFNGPGKINAYDLSELGAMIGTGTKEAEVFYQMVLDKINGGNSSSILFNVEWVCSCVIELITQGILSSEQANKRIKEA